MTPAAASRQKSLRFTVVLIECRLYNFSENVPDPVKAVVFMGVDTPDLDKGQQTKGPINHDRSQIFYLEQINLIYNKVYSLRSDRIPRNCKTGI